jgi:uncharacterized membrane protein
MLAQRILTVLVAIAAVLGFAFASVSTSDFTAHLDRQIHGIHCSFVPGADTPDVSGTSGCHATMMSPYSSVMRESIWGGIPVSLPAMAVFAYLVFLAVALLVSRKEGDPRAAGYQALAWLLPFSTSLVFGFLSFHELGAACKLCIGIYTASTLGLGLAFASFLRARNAAYRMPATLDDVDERMGPAPRIRRRAAESEEASTVDETVRDDQEMATGDADTVQADEGARIRLATASQMDRRLRAKRAMSGEAPSPTPSGISWGALVTAFVVGVVFVVTPVLVYASSAPDFDHYIGSCGRLEHPEAPSAGPEGDVFVAIGPQTREVAMIEVLDPLCPSCRGFEHRFREHRAASEVSRRALLFPLDTPCNWMIRESIHPGACVVSQAVLCAEGDAEEVLDWAFDHQEAIHDAAAAAADGATGGADAREAAASAAVTRMVRERFSSLADCIGSPRAEARLNRSLRWAVANHLPVLTPQVYVDSTRLCDEDTDIGLDWALSRLLDREEGGGR